MVRKRHEIIAKQLRKTYDRLQSYERVTKSLINNVTNNERIDLKNEKFTKLFVTLS